MEEKATKVDIIKMLIASLKAASEELEDSHGTDCICESLEDDEGDEKCVMCNTHYDIWYAEQFMKKLGIVDLDKYNQPSIEGETDGASD